MIRTTIEKTLYLLLILSIPSIVYGQVDAELRGVVKDKNGLPVFTATVVLQNTTKGAVTDENGAFVRVGGHNIMMSPPLIVTEDHVNEIISALVKMIPKRIPTNRNFTFFIKPK